MKSVILTIVFILGTVPVARAAQPHQIKAREFYLNSSCFVEQANLLKLQGFQEGDTSTAIISAQYFDEGVDGYYIASTYFVTGGKPWERASATVTALVVLSHGYMASVYCLEADKAMKVLIETTQREK